jgi:hypothetical protein
VKESLMSARNFQVTLAAAAVRLSRAYASGAGDVEPSAAENLPYRQLLLSASGADAFVGAGAGVTATNFGIAVVAAAATVEGVVSIGPFETGPVKLSDFWAAGAGATLHILGIPY